MTEKFFCASRAQSPAGARLAPDGDEWTTELNGDRTCSFCGSLHPDGLQNSSSEQPSPETRCRSTGRTRLTNGTSTQPGVIDATEGGIKFYTCTSRTRNTLRPDQRQYAESGRCFRSEERQGATRNHGAPVSSNVGGQSERRKTVGQILPACDFNGGGECIAKGVRGVPVQGCGGTSAPNISESKPRSKNRDERWEGLNPKCAGFGVTKKSAVPLTGKGLATTMTAIGEPVGFMATLQSQKGLPGDVLGLLARCTSV